MPLVSKNGAPTTQHYQRMESSGRDKMSCLETSDHQTAAGDSGESQSALSKKFLMC